MKIYGNLKTMGTLYIVIYIFVCLGVLIFATVNLWQIISSPTVFSVILLQQSSLAVESVLIFLGLASRFNASIPLLNSKWYWLLLIVVIIVTHLASLAISVDDLTNVFFYSVFAIVSLAFCWAHWNTKVEKVNGPQAYQISKRD